MTISARFLSTYPKRIQVTDGLTKSEANGVITLGFDYDSTELGAELAQAVETSTDNAASAAASAEAAADSADEAAASAAASANSVVGSIADLRDVTPIANKLVNVLGYYSALSKGGSSYIGVTGASAGTYVDNGGSIIVPTGGNGSTAWLSQHRLLNALQWGCKGDGVTDDTVRSQAMVDANKGFRCTWDAGVTFLIGGLALVGSSYNKTELNFEGTLLVKARVDANDKNFQSLVFVGVAVENADNVRIDGNFNGNLTNQYSIEQTFVICLCGVTNFKSDYLSFRNLSADGVYITTQAITSNSANSDRLTFGLVIGENTTNAGRNLISLISGDNCTIGVIGSEKVGGTIGGFLMPGGFDCEPDTSYQSCKNLKIGTANIRSAGGSGFTIYAQPGSGGTVGARVGTLTVINTSAADATDGLGATTITENTVLNIQNTEDVEIASFYGSFENAPGVGMFIGPNKRLKINGSVRNVHVGAKLCSKDFTDPEGPSESSPLLDSKIEVEIDYCYRYGFQTGNVDGCQIKGRVTNPQTGLFSARFAVFSEGWYLDTDPESEVDALVPTSFNQSGTTYSVDVPYHANWTRAYENNSSSPNTFTNTHIANMSFGSSADWGAYLKMVNMPVLVFNAIGYTNTTLGVPTEGRFLAGQHLRDESPTAGATTEYYCTVAGTPGTWKTGAVISA